MRNLLFIFSLLTCLASFGQDTTIVFNNYKYKIGAKILVDHSGDLTLTDDASFVTSGGIQVVRRFGQTRSSLESGLYMMTKAVGKNYERIVFRNISVPINYRFDTKVFYVAGGPFVDYLISRENPTEYAETLYTDRDLNFGFNLTLGIEKSMGKHYNLLVEFHHINNLTSYRTTNGEFLSQSFINNGFSIGVNYKLLK